MCAYIYQVPPASPPTGSHAPPRPSTVQSRQSSLARTFLGLHSTHDRPHFNPTNLAHTLPLPPTLTCAREGAWASCHSTRASTSSSKFFFPSLARRPYSRRLQGFAPPGPATEHWSHITLRPSSHISLCCSRRLRHHHIARVPCLTQVSRASLIHQHVFSHLPPSIPGLVFLRSSLTQPLQYIPSTKPRSFWSWPA